MFAYLVNLSDLSQEVSFDLALNQFSINAYRKKK